VGPCGNALAFICLTILHFQIVNIDQIEISNILFECFVEVLHYRCVFIVALDLDYGHIYGFGVVTDEVFNFVSRLALLLKVDNALYVGLFHVVSLMLSAFVSFFFEPAI